MPLHSVQDLLSTNDVPSRLEELSIREDIDSLSQQISKLSLELQDLEDRRQKRRAALSAIRKIPIEVLGKIFTFVLPLQLGENGRKELVGLSLVCKGWCRAVHLTHSLWSGLSIEGVPSYEKVSAWFARAGDLPKAMSIWVPECGWPPHVQCQLIQSLGIVGRRPWDMIKTLALFFHCGSPWVEEGESGTVLDTPLAITSLQLWFDENPHTFEQPLPLGISPSILKHLTSFSVCWFKEMGEELLLALKHCAASLESLELDFSSRDWTGPSDADSNLLLFPRLTSLCVRGGGSDTMIFIKYLITPALIELDLSVYPDNEDVYDLPSYAEAPMKCHNNIRVLRLAAPYLVPERLANMLARFPSLTHLALSFCLSKSPNDGNFVLYECAFIFRSHRGLHQVSKDLQEAEDRGTLNQPAATGYRFAGNSDDRAGPL
ncbi:hypothetical protein MD484_g4514, partial [Candolleomyces efflorescens]